MPWPSRAFTGGIFEATHWVQIAFGCLVPAPICGATYILARLVRRQLCEVENE
jgi:hypothetical protein